MRNGWEAPSLRANTQMLQMLGLPARWRRAPLAREQYSAPSSSPGCGAKTAGGTPPLDAPQRWSLKVSIRSFANLQLLVGLSGRNPEAARERRGQRGPPPQPWLKFWCIGWRRRREQRAVRLMIRPTGPVNVWFRAVNSVVGALGTGLFWLGISKSDPSDGAYFITLQVS